ncbi:MAG: 50S ribosomal protein L11 methyltransferase [Ignavibacteriaceae bacterium]
MKNYTEFIISFHPFIPDIVTGLLWELNISGITENDNSIIVYSDSEFSISKEQIEDILQNLKSERIINDFSVEQHLVADRNWNEEWEKNINIIKTGSRFVIKPSFRNYIPEPGEIVITIDPKMSFGTGEHPTTKLMLQMIDKFVKDGMRVIDVGSGTAVLAIAAVMSGAASAIAIDNDQWCYENGIENCKLNKVQDKIEVKLASIENISGKNFDLIAANIQKDVLLNISDEIYDKLKEGGTAILSGLLKDDENEINRKYYSSGFNLISKKQMDEWIALVFRK